MIAFCGPCRVDLKEMVDQEDVKAKAPIRSPLMLHFMAEFFGENLETTIVRQRLLMACVLEALRENAPTVPFRRDGDDIYVGPKKMSVSIATASPVSTLIHAGLNITTKGTPIPTYGLKDAKIEPKEFALAVLKAFQKETEEMDLARCKVRGVP